MIGKSHLHLMLGGPLDGQWVVPRGNPHVITTMPPMVVDLANVRAALDETSPCPEMPEIAQHSYWLDRVSLFGYSLSVGLHEQTMRTGLDNKTDMLLRTILQRDVATHLGIKQGRH